MKEFDLVVQMTRSEETRQQFLEKIKQEPFWLTYLDCSLIKHIVREGCVNFLEDVLQIYGKEFKMVDQGDSTVRSLAWNGYFDMYNYIINNNIFESYSTKNQHYLFLSAALEQDQNIAVAEILRVMIVNEMVDKEVLGKLLRKPVIKANMLGVQYLLLAGACISVNDYEAMRLCYILSETDSILYNEMLSWFRQYGGDRTIIYRIDFTKWNGGYQPLTPSLFSKVDGYKPTTPEFTDAIYQMAVLSKKDLAEFWSNL